VAAEAFFKKEADREPANPENQFAIEVAFEGEAVCAPVAAYGHPDYRLIDGDKIITTEKEITIRFDYPLSQPAELKFESPDGFTVERMYKAIHDGYRRIYAEEGDDPGTMPGTYNRRRSHGPHGIWGHVVEDLSIAWIEQTRPGYFTLAIDS